ncbi:MAG: hypothetical protein Tsb0017_23870 [Geothermobacteraceae bacterium]
MKPAVSDSLPLLVLDDGRPGHVNQSLAFARLTGREVVRCRVGFRHRAGKALSYLCDRLGLTVPGLVRLEDVTGPFAAVVSAGSDTWYANRLLARRLNCRSVALMLPKGYRLDFDLIIAQQHDHPPVAGNILALPVNLNWSEPAGLVVPEDDRPVVAVVVGGDSRHGKLDQDRLESQLKSVFNVCAGSRFWLTTSRRTGQNVEKMLRRFPFDYALYYSSDPRNPMGDFLQYADRLFVTADSTSMISEAVCWGTAAVDILPVTRTLPTGKTGRMLFSLQKDGYVHLFDGAPGEARRKVDLKSLLAEVRL